MKITDYIKTTFTLLIVLLAFTLITSFPILVVVFISVVGGVYISKEYKKFQEEEEESKSNEDK